MPLKTRSLERESESESVKINKIIKPRVPLHKVPEEQRRSSLKSFKKVDSLKDPDLYSININVPLGNSIDGKNRV